MLVDVPMAPQQLVEKAMASAQRAFDIWSNTQIVKRSQIFYKFKQLLEDEFDNLAKLLSLEHGKIVAESKCSLRHGLEVVEFACRMPAVYKDSTLRNVGGGFDYEMHRFPLGVCAGITPFNFPAMIPLWMFPVAIIAGNMGLFPFSQVGRIHSLVICMYRIWKE